MILSKEKGGDMDLKNDAVFEGGGVKGIALAGAISVMEKEGYEFVNLAGTSAGAIVASLLAVGYSADELKVILEELNYNNFKDEGLLDKLPFIGKGLSIGLEYGIYEGDYFENWFEELLQSKGKTKFGDIKTEFEEINYQYTVQVIAADITDRKLLVLPGDLKDFGYDPDQFLISRAVRMSMSIPIFFEPVKIQDSSGRTHFIVDGGLLSNYPIWLLDDDSPDPPWPTFGFKLIEPDKRQLKGPNWNPINNPISFLKSLITTMVEAHDNYHISNSEGDYARTIGISTVVKINGNEKEIKATDFDLSRKESDALYENGVKAANEFLKDWNFDDWKQKYRAKK
jgi:NTE family protein